MLLKAYKKPQVLTSVDYALNRGEILMPNRTTGILSLFKINLSIFSEATAYSFDHTQEKSL